MHFGKPDQRLIEDLVPASPVETPLTYSIVSELPTIQELVGSVNTAVAKPFRRR
jgi:hypothetical protein